MKEPSTRVTLEKVRRDLASTLVELEGLRDHYQRLLASLPQEYPEEMTQGKVAASLQFQLFWMLGAAIEKVSEIIRHLRSMSTLSVYELAVEWERPKTKRIIAEIEETLQHVADKIDESGAFDSDKLVS